MSDSLNRSLSALSINTVDSQPEDDWDRSLLDVVAVPLPSTPPRPSAPLDSVAQPQHTPRNSVAFPAEDTPGRHTRYSSSGGLHSKNGSLDSSSVGKGHGKRTLSELLRLHSEKGCAGKFSQEEASRIADVLGQWINASSSPYEGEDDFFARSQSQDDISIASRRPIPVQVALAAAGRPRGRSESANSLSNHSRPPSSTGFAGSS
ncbi:hypothetical protein M413DRAFT_444670 [Hebeloma cylindrosporum]|uniref:Uncharacterized protein n=1 Tax=Hebeloma cylindrosporum TaxID=76867 RepID=A0A0C3C031_HEBCY|nr:hypothetical protein M413DRAFT_444670 [Hebeloma cylindrosporum h7]